MSQTALVGVNGSGKTHYAVLEIIKGLKNKVKRDGTIVDGRHVYTNIEGMNEPAQLKNLARMTCLAMGELLYRFHWLSDEVIVDECPKAVEGALIVIDECHELICNRKWREVQNEAFAKYGARHRHQHHDLILITQHIGKIDSHVRTNTNWTFFFRKIDFFGSLVSNGYLRYIYAGDNHEGQPINKPSKHSYSADVHSCYKSTQNSEIKEMGLSFKVNVLNRPIFWAIPVVICVCLYYIFINKSSLLRGGSLPAKKGEAQAATLPVSKSGVVAAVAPLPVFNQYSAARVLSAPKPFTLIKINGYIKKDGRTYINVASASISLPCPYIQNVNLPLLICEIKTDYYNVINTPPSAVVPTPSAPIIPAVVKPAPPSAPTPVPVVAEPELIKHPSPTVPGKSYTYIKTMTRL